MISPTVIAVDYSLMKSSTLLFDSDGVLAHTEDVFLEANTLIFKKMGIAHTCEDFIRYTFLTNLGTGGFLREHGFDEESIHQFWKEQDLVWHTIISKKLVVSTRTTDVIQTLSKHFKLGIVTNASQEIFSMTYNKSNLPSFINLVVTREKYKNPKPAPDCYLTAINLLETQPGSTLVIEDSPRGISAAKNAGIKVIGIKNPHFPELDISNADMQIDDISELLKL